MDNDDYEYPQADKARGEVERYDAGLLNDFGGGNVDWWWDYIRSELDRAHDFYESQITTPQPRWDGEDDLAKRVGFALVRALQEDYGPTRELAETVQLTWRPDGEPRIGRMSTPVIARLSTPQARPSDGVICIKCGLPTMHIGNVCYDCSHPEQARPDGENAEPWGCDVCGKFDCTAAMHPAPAPDVARLVEAAKDARFALYGNGPGNPALDAALAPFIATKQDGK